VVHAADRSSPQRQGTDALKSLLAFKRELPRGVVDIIKTFPRTPPSHAIRTAVSLWAVSIRKRTMIRWIENR